MKDPNTDGITYLPGLNGIRGFAATAVVIAHVTLSIDSFGLDPHIFGTYADGKPKTLDLAGYGVSMFFALSGFLITFLLQKERAKSKINITKFYLRRVLRIWPPYYLYFLMCLVTYYIFELQFDGGSLAYYLFFGANIPFITGTELLFLGHYWSLGVEEQFYMFWPWLNVLKLNYLKITTFLVSVFLLGLKIFLHFFHPNSTLELVIHVTRFHCMMIGAIAALLYFKNHVIVIKYCTHWLVQSIAWFILILVALNKYHFASVIDNEIITCITVLIILGQITGKGLIDLEKKALDFMGKISYGLYVYHPLIIFYFAKYVDFEFIPIIPRYFIVFGAILLSSIMVAHLSYKYFETPFLKIKTRKYSVIHSKSHMG